MRQCRWLFNPTGRLPRFAPYIGVWFPDITGNISQRRDVLLANGGEPNLIVHLLEDANTWIDLRRLLHNQVDTIGVFRVDYDQYGYGDPAIDNLAPLTQEFVRAVDSRIDKLDESSSTLVQLEFNLTSIREAQKSTTLNRSMKRLTWITVRSRHVVSTAVLADFTVHIPPTYLHSGLIWNEC